MSSNRKVAFKSYNHNQMMLLPPSLEELIDAHHPVRVVNQVIESIDLEPVLQKYKGGGTSSYHPRMLLKILVYGYLCNIFSSRKLEAASKDNIHFLWLTGMSRPDHNTINRFRSERLKGVLKEVFTQVVLMLVESGHLDLKAVYTDGTKIEANANRYTFVWGKSIKTSRQRIARQLEELWAYTEQVAKEELSEKPEDFSALDAEKVEQTIDQINEALQEKKTDPKVRQKVRYAKKNWPAKLKEYDEKEKILAGRNSYSKTDKDATFMRMKEDHMQNGQLKPGYNLQVSTQNQIIVHYTLHQKPTDTTTLIPHYEDLEKHYGKQPQAVCADAGYGSEENYEYMARKGINAFVKYNYFHKEQKSKGKTKLSDPSALHYDQEQDRYYCPIGQPMDRIGSQKSKTSTGYPQHYTVYQAKNCHGCPLRASCHKQKGNRKLAVNHRLNRYKAQARENLLSEEGIRHRKKRPCDVEAVFGNLKQNKHFKRFWLRGLEKVEIETGLMAMAHNIAKLAG